MMIVPGMTFTIEPMINEGVFNIKVLKDKWTAVTTDGKLSAQFEHMIGVTDDGCEVFTRSPAGLDKPPYAGTGSNFTVPGWTAGDRTSWESQLKARTQRGQNEYNRSVVAR